MYSSHPPLHISESLCQKYYQKYFLPRRPYNEL
jgi:hypothetical protein